MKEKILVGGLFHEGNSFSPLTTSAASFVIVNGQDVLEQAATSGAGLGGAYRYLAQQDVTIVPYRKAIACPGGPVIDDVYRDYRDALIQAAAAERYSGIYLELHGAMLTVSLDDPEGDLLTALRSAAGSDTTIAVSLDLHGYVTDAMLSNADVIVACKVNPHSDFHLAGELAAKLMLQTIRKEVRPVTCVARVPLFIGAKMETAHGPLSELHALRERLMVEHPTLLDISIYNTQPLLDVPDGGQTITVIADGDERTAKSVAQTIAEEFWRRRDSFEPDAPALSTVLDDLENGRIQKPAILGDNGDGVLAGTPGDNTAIIHEMLTRPHLKAAIPITDPDVVQMAKNAGVGGRISASIGGKYTAGVEPVTGDWEVINLSDGRYVMAGPLMANEAAELGETAVLRQGNLFLMVTSIPGFTQDVAAFRSQKIRPEDFDVLVAKSAFHYKLSFADVGHCVTVDTPGITSYKKGSLPFAKKRNIYPEDPMSIDDIKYNTFERF